MIHLKFTALKQRFWKWGCFQLRCTLWIYHIFFQSAVRDKKRDASLLQYLNRCIFLDLHVIICDHDYLGCFLSIWIRGDWFAASSGMECFYSSSDCPFLTQKHGAVSQRGSVVSIYFFHSRKMHSVYLVIMAVTSEAVSSFIPSCCKSSLPWPHLFVVFFSLRFHLLIFMKENVTCLQHRVSIPRWILTVNPLETWNKQAFLFIIRHSLDTEILSWCRHFWNKNCFSFISGVIYWPRSSHRLQNSAVSVFSKCYSIYCLLPSLLPSLQCF